MPLFYICDSGYAVMLYSDPFRHVCRVAAFSARHEAVRRVWRAQAQRKSLHLIERILEGLKATLPKVIQLILTSLIRYGLSSMPKVHRDR
ncbi:hypothetical protein PILCRDRAFT_458623 [Piloderma croceum F 1598]|uniref:Uncharacterized protein n=1 Tax=Piloderma croceum (strain F 1598) TaxID=765440 RepID=A0A0C3BZQ0_PILCF|nr:hypothetical protein PILCRDRAFT_458623 [Piloderma croceum F 1598]